jgi:hypothetical protein
LTYRKIIRRIALPVRGRPPPSSSPRAALTIPSHCSRRSRALAENVRLPTSTAPPLAIAGTRAMRDGLLRFATCIHRRPGAGGLEPWTSIGRFGHSRPMAGPPFPQPHAVTDGTAAESDCSPLSGPHGCPAYSTPYTRRTGAQRSARTCRRMRLCYRPGRAPEWRPGRQVSRLAPGSLVFSCPLERARA